MFNLALKRLASILLFASGWILAAIRTTLDLIGWSTAPDDVGVAMTRLDQFFAWLLAVPWWIPWGFALLSTGWLMYVSWPRTSTVNQAEVPRGGEPIPEPMQSQAPTTQGTTFFSPAVTQSEPPPWIGEKGLYVGFMQIDANKLADDLYVDIVIRGFNASGLPIQVANIIGSVGYRIVEGSSAVEKGVLPLPKWITDRGPTTGLEHLAEFQLILEQRVPKTLANMFVKSLDTGHVQFDLQDLNAGVTAGENRLRLPLWSGITLRRYSNDLTSGRIITARLQAGSYAINPTSG